MEKTGLATDLGGMVTFRRFSIPYTDLTTAGLTQTIKLFTLPKGGVILGVRIKHSTAFTGTAWSAANVSVGGTTAGATAYASAFDIFATVSASAMQMTNQFKEGTYADEAINAYFTSVGGFLSVGLTGVVNIDVLFLNVTTDPAIML